MDSTKNTDSSNIDHWKKQAQKNEQRANDLQQELDEYTENSAQLEKELETSLAQAEKENRDLKYQNNRFRNEIEMLRNKLDRSQHEVNALEGELQALKVERDKQNVYVRELEQKNDDLERGQRVISESVSYIEALLNQAYERNAVLESEVDEKETLKIELQRISDEARDLKLELKVKERIPPIKKEDSANENVPVNGHMLTSASGHVETETQTIPVTPQKREVNGNGMTPSARVSAINIVGDLLRKVGLEKFLCRECGKVKCSCEQAAPLGRDVTREPEPSCFPYNNGHIGNNSGSEHSDTESVEYRSKGQFTRQNSDRNDDVNTAQSSRLSYRLSEQPFTRNGDNGKLRKSFIVRSREGIENFLNITSTRKTQDPTRPNKSNELKL